MNTTLTIVIVVLLAIDTLAWFAILALTIHRHRAKRRDGQFGGIPPIAESSLTVHPPSSVNVAEGGKTPDWWPEEKRRLTEEHRRRGLRHLRDGGG